MEAEVCPTRSLDELQLIVKVRFVSDKDTGVELKIKVGVNTRVYTQRLVQDGDWRAM